MQREEQLYLQRVDQTLEQIRALCLGQSVRLTSILPSHVQARPIEHQARQLSEEILFALAKMYKGEISPQQLSHSRDWLYGVSLYLLQECREEDQTFQEFKRLINLPQHIRRILFENFLSAPKALTEKEPPALLQNLDGAIWYLLNVHELAAPAKEFYGEFFYFPPQKDGLTS